jgi:thiamine-phosphate pyrophosphorylase
MIDGGVDVIQLRGKNESLAELVRLTDELHEMTASASVPFVVNDYPEVARARPVEGVHVGQDDESVAQARQTVGRPVLIGKSTHSLDQAIAAANEGADYIGFGPLFATPTKPDYIPIGLDLISEVHRRVTLPIFCIGGIKLHNLSEVIAAGAKRVVIVSGLLQADDISEYAASCKKLLTAA